MPTPPAPKSPPPASFRLWLRELKFTLSTPQALLVIMAVALFPNILDRLLQIQTGPLPMPAPQVPMLETTPAAALPALAAIIPGGLPTPGPNQKRSGTCDPERAQIELSGGCWVATDTPPPCPRGKQWEHEGRCWLPVAEAKPVPTSGEPHRAGVADP
jgi:hypothetical protein